MQAAKAQDMQSLMQAAKITGQAKAQDRQAVTQATRALAKCFQLATHRPTLLQVTYSFRIHVGSNSVEVLTSIALKGGFEYTLGHCGFFCV